MKTKHVQYQTHGTCSQLIDVTADENDVIQQVFFLGGCNGNLQGISQLVRGQRIDDVIPRLNGIRCGAKSTSCPDQLCRALEQLKSVVQSTGAAEAGTSQGIDTLKDKKGVKVIFHALHRISTACT